MIVIGGLDCGFPLSWLFQTGWTSLTMTSFENLNGWGENVNRHRHITNYKEVWVTVFSHFQLAGTGRVSRFMSPWYQISIRYRYQVWNTYPGWWFGTMESYSFPYIGNVIIRTDEHIFQSGTMWGPPVISWFISPSNYSYKHHKP